MIRRNPDQRPTVPGYFTLPEIACHRPARGGAVRSGQPAGSGLGPGSVVAGYRIEAEISRGAMATVFRAHDERLGRTVALKILAPELATDHQFRARFMRESRATAITD